MDWGPYKAVIRDWHDGDTCHADLDLGFGVILNAYNLDGKAVLRLRVAGINAPELRVPEGQAALEFARILCPNGTHATVFSHSWDEFGGRFDASITLPDGRNFGDEMIKAGHAVPFMTKG